MGYPPTLIVDGDPADWLVDMRYRRYPIRKKVRVDGPLPTVYLSDKQGPTRPLRVGDRVTLATVEVERDETSGGEWPLGPVPFATATVTDVEPWSYMDRDDHGYHITVTNVQPLESQ